MKIIGLTGPTGSGKTTVSSVARSLGFAVVDCDKLARKAVENKEVLRALSSAFGEDIVENGVLNRKETAARAFKDEASKKILESITFPEIMRLVNAEIKNAELSGAAAVILDAPTLIESGLDSRCDGIIAVLCRRDVRKQRIILRDGISETDAEIRLNAGKPDEFYKNATENILDGAESLDAFTASAEKMLKSMI